jgi:hypothetical protein
MHKIFIDLKELIVPSIINVDSLLAAIIFFAGAFLAYSLIILLLRKVHKKIRRSFLGFFIIALIGVLYIVTKILIKYFVHFGFGVLAAFFVTVSLYEESHKQISIISKFISGFIPIKYDNIDIVNAAVDREFKNI